MPGAAKLAEKTGGQVDRVCKTLIKNGNDDDETVQTSMFQSLEVIGSAQPRLVLTTAVDFVREFPQTPGNHRANLLKLMSTIIDDRGSDADNRLLGEELSKDIVAFSLNEMVELSEKQVQMAAVNLMVSLSHQYCDEVLEGVLQHFTSGRIPSYYVMKCLADIADANPLAFTPKLEEVYPRVVPILGALKKPVEKSIFTTCLGNFADAVIAFESEADEKLQDSVNRAEFQTSCATAFDVVFQNWRKDRQLKLSVAQALGKMCEVMSEQKFEQRFIDVVKYYCDFIKKEDNPGPLVNGIVSVLKVTQKTLICDRIDDSEKYIGQILDTLHPLTAKLPDYSDQKSLQTHRELLQCFEYLTLIAQTQTIGYILNRLQSNKAGLRMGSLFILRHLVNALDEELQAARSLILASCQVLMGEGNYSVRKAFIQLIMGMADQGYLNLEGGTDMVLFLIKQSSITKKEIELGSGPNAKGGITPDQIRHGADHILHVISTKVESSHEVLWPYVFERLVLEEHHEAMGTLCRVVSHIARLKRRNDDPSYMVQWNMDANLPRPFAILTRLFIVLNEPLKHERFGEYICSCMHVIGSIIHPTLEDLWHQRFMEMGKFLNRSKADEVEEEFPDMLLELFRDTCEAVQEDDVFLTGIGDSLEEQLKLYKTHKLRAAVFTFLGQALAFSKKKTWITQRTTELLKNVDKTNMDEIEGSGKGLGLCASVHLDIVLVRCTEILQSVQTRQKKKGWFSFGGSKVNPKKKDTQIMLVRVWGHVAGATPPNLMTSRLEAHVMTHLLPIVESKQNDLRESVIVGVDRIAQAMIAAFDTTEFVVKGRDRLVSGLLTYVKEGNSFAFRSKSMNSIATLLYLQPPLTCKAPLRQEVFECALAHLNNNSQDDGKEQEVPVKGRALALEGMTNILLALLETVPTVESLCQLLFKIEYWVVSQNVIERKHALTAYQVLSKRFVKILRSGVTQTEQNLKNIGHYLAHLVPRVTDENAEVRQTSLETIQLLLYIDQLLRSPGDDRPSDILRSLNTMKKEMAIEKVPENRLDYCQQLAEILCRLISAQEMETLLPVLIQGVNDTDASACLGVCRALQGLLLSRANETRLYVEKLMEVNVDELHKRLGDGPRSKSKDESPVVVSQLQSVCILTREHFEAVMEWLLKQKIPVSKEILLVFKALARDDVLRKPLLDYLLDKINNTPISANEVTPFVYISTKALEVLFPLEPVKELVHEYYYEFLATLLTRIGTASGKNLKKPKSADAQPPPPPNKSGIATKGVVEALYAFLEAAEELLLLIKLRETDTKAKLLKKKYEEGIAEFVAHFASAHPNRRRQLFESIVPFSRKHYVGQRNSVATVLAELIRHCGDEARLLDELVRDMLPRVADHSPQVRRQSLLGLGNLKEVWSRQLFETGPAVLSALTSGIEDQDNDCATTAINALSLVLDVIDEETVWPHMISICFRTRPYFDSEAEPIREVSFRLFACLIRFGTGNYAQNFNDQVQANLATFVLHCNDFKDNVSESCLDTFKQVAAYIEDEDMVQVLEAGHVGKAGYVQLLAHLVPVLVEHYPNNLTTYLQACVQYIETTKWSEVRANAALFAAKIIQCSPESLRRSLDVHAVTTEILKLVKHKSARVRARAAKALSFLAEV